MFRTLQHEFGIRVHAVAGEQWRGPTPNASWDVAELVAHLITEHLWVEPLMRGLDMDAAATEVDRARTSTDGEALDVRYTRGWDAAADRSLAAFSVPDALEQTVLLSRGPTLARSYIRELIFDLIVHAWDLDQAIDFPGHLPTDVVQTVWDESNQFGDLSASGMFDHPVPVPDDAPVLDRLIAQSGRDPRWTDTLLDR